MTRVLEVIVSLLIVFVLAVVVGACLPDHGRIERSVEVSSPVRQVFDSVDTFHRYSEWAALRRYDPQALVQLEGPESGVGAKVTWNGANVGQGALSILSTEQDAEVRMGLDNDWAGENKTYTVTLVPSTNGKTVRIKWAYDVDYGWNLRSRYAGLYIHGAPDQQVQSYLANLAAMLATFPNVDYKDQDIQVVDVAAKPVLLISTKAKRTLDEVAEATDAAVATLEAVIKKAGLEAIGPAMTITTNWGDENYVYDVAIPVNASTFTLDKREFTIAPAADEPASDDEDSDEPKTYAAGDIDKDGYLVVEDRVRAVQWYAGKALVTEHTGSPAQLPLMRLKEKAYAETHGYTYAEMGQGRFWDERTSSPDVSEEEQTFRTYLPIQIQP